MEELMVMAERERRRTKKCCNVEVSSVKTGKIQKITYIRELFCIEERAHVSRFNWWYTLNGAFSSEREISSSHELTSLDFVDWKCELNRRVWVKYSINVIYMRDFRTL